MGKLRYRQSEKCYQVSVATMWWSWNMNELWRAVWSHNPYFLPLPAILQLAAGGPKDASTRAKIFTQSLEAGRQLLGMQTWKEVRSGQNKQCEEGQESSMFETIVS